MITAVVSNGDLLIELEDGSVINAGRVQGPAGLNGSQGLSGIPGEEGRPGRDGTNGASILTGLGVPDPSDHSNGDIYIDVQTVDLNLYQKINGQWARLGSLKGQPGAPGAAGTAGSGGGGSVIIHPSPDGSGPNQGNDGTPITEGDMWFDPETGYIWVWNGTEWAPVADRPPVIISEDAPEYNNASDGTTNYPIQNGDLWLDPEGNILYIYRDGVWSEITSCGGGGADGDYLARYGDNVTNATDTAVYQWNKGLTFKANNTSEINFESEKLYGTANMEIKFRSKYFSVEMYGQQNAIVTARFGDVLIDSTEGSGEYIQRVIDKNVSTDKQITNKAYVDAQDEILKEYVDNTKGLIQVLPGNPTSPEVGDAWFSTNQNTLIIKIS
jgi:hypothetical protein